MRHFPAAHIVIQHPYLHSVTSPVNQGISNQSTYRIILKNIKLQMDVMTSHVNIFQQFRQHGNSIRINCNSISGERQRIIYA